MPISAPTSAIAAAKRIGRVEVDHRRQLVAGHQRLHHWPPAMIWNRSQAAPAGVFASGAAWMGMSTFIAPLPVGKDEGFIRLPATALPPMAALVAWERELLRAIQSEMDRQGGADVERDEPPPPPPPRSDPTPSDFGPGDDDIPF